MKFRDRTDIDAPDVLAIYGELVAAGLLADVKLHPAEEQSWADCDLALLAENRIADRTDPRVLDDARRAHWQSRVTLDPCLLPSARASERCFWLLQRGERVGTVALAASLFGARLVRLSSLYVFPTHRGRGLGTSALRGLRTALAVHGLGIRLETSWSWMSAVHFYVRLGFWLQMWKHDLTFRCDMGAPAPVIDVKTDSATLSVDRDGQRVVLVRAARDQHRLLFLESAHETSDERVYEFAAHAESTLCLALALHGWPLIRSQRAWDTQRHSDALVPEALAYKIVIWEAWERKHGWRVRAPTIPGLPYCTWEQLEAEWAR